MKKIKLELIFETFEIGSKVCSYIISFRKYKGGHYETKVGNQVIFSYGKYNKGYYEKYGRWSFADWNGYREYYFEIPQKEFDEMRKKLEDTGKIKKISIGEWE
tara:strand:- start:19 stop:327 length:309 start_codon:yes stop_codon:yes gene_type:complete